MVLYHTFKMEGKYSFERMEEELDNGYQIYFTYVRNRYQLFKTSDNCYTQQLFTEEPKNPLPRLSIITKKRLKEIYPYMEAIEYKSSVASEEKEKSTNDKI